MFREKGGRGAWGAAVNSSATKLRARTSPPLSSLRKTQFSDATKSVVSGTDIGAERAYAQCACDYLLAPVIDTGGNDTSLSEGVLSIGAISPN